MNPALGEVWAADLGLAAKFRPVVVISRQDADPPRALVIYIPITSQNRGSKYEVGLPKVRFLDEGSVANVQGIGSVPNNRLGRKLGRLPVAAMNQIKEALRWALELDFGSEP